MILYVKDYVNIPVLINNLWCWYCNVCACTLKLTRNERTNSLRLKHILVRILGIALQFTLSFFFTNSLDGGGKPGEVLESFEVCILQTGVNSFLMRRNSGCGLQKIRFKIN
jgi:hypothetical protein